MTTKEQERQFRDAVAHEMRSCVHFNGVFVNSECKAGVDYHGMLGTGIGCFKHLPCLSDPKSPVECGLRVLPSREEAEKAIRADDAAVDLALRVIPAVKAHANAAGFGNGNPGTGSMPCPSDCGGEVRYGIASNGHSVGKCSTGGCVSWRE